MNWRWLRFGVIACLALILAVVTLVVRSLRDGAVQMQLSDEAFHRGDVWAATVHARRAALAYVPFAGHTDLAFLRLKAAAEGAEARGDWRLAQMAYRAIRAAALETSYVHQPREQELVMANSKLALLQVLNDGSPSGERDSRYGKALQQLSVTKSAPFSGLLVLLALGAAIAVILHFALRPALRTAGAELGRT